MPLIDAHRVRLANLRLQLLQVQRRQDFLVVAILLKDQTQHQLQRRCTMWVKPWLLRRVTLGHYDTLMQELMRESRGDLKSFLRMEPEMFDRVAPRIEKRQEGRLPLSPGLKLANTLRFLSTGNSYHSLDFCYRTVIVGSSCGARTIDVTPYGDRALPLQPLHGLRTGAVRLVHKRRTT